ncbi:uncharacterized protein BDZ99DRAFT_467789 [Mytilinidion resinicola]|uniref:Uncharacterized protein n=1 Tax=Mytilinidion resinicola TaxID=574789 RepID=A0A6A6Y7Y0_9PEZI|nr:uncharacterized protein BDZ99DRAFT_467789 [Mytilinidion resinicola]KAF2804074.1 hypothetical protein BDZ99DRAFT_467789 [Mytilinidion resinicola]
MADLEPEGHDEDEMTDIDITSDDEPTPITEEFREAGLVWKPSKKADCNRISFLDCPREVWDEVYRASLLRGDVERDMYSYCGEGPRFVFSPYYDPPLFVLFSVCQQLRAEAQQVYYQETTFIQEGGTLDDFRMILLEDPNCRDNYCTILRKFYDPFRCACVIVPEPYSSLVRRLDLSITWSCYSDGPLTKATKNAVAMITAAFPKISATPNAARVDFRINCASFYCHPTLSKVNPREIPVERAVDLLASALGLELALPEWFKLSFSESQREWQTYGWQPVWEALKESGKFTNV